VGSKKFRASSLSFFGTQCKVVEEPDVSKFFGDRGDVGVPSQEVSNISAEFQVTVSQFCRPKYVVCGYADMPTSCPPDMIPKAALVKFR
jgi:hypothetical protein